MSCKKIMIVLIGLFVAPVVTSVGLFYVLFRLGPVVTFILISLVTLFSMWAAVISARRSKVIPERAKYVALSVAVLSLDFITLYYFLVLFRFEDFVGNSAAVLSPLTSVTTAAGALIALLIGLASKKSPFTDRFVLLCGELLVFVGAICAILFSTRTAPPFEFFIYVFTPLIALLLCGGTLMAVGLLGYTASGGQAGDLSAP